MIALDRSDLETQAAIASNRLGVDQALRSSEYAFDDRDSPYWVPTGARCPGSRLLALWLGLSENQMFSALLGGDAMRCRAFLRFVNSSIASPEFLRFATALELNLNPREAVHVALERAIQLFLDGGLVDKELWRGVRIWPRALEERKKGAVKC